MTGERMTAIKSADVERFIARPDPGQPIVLIYGPDTGLVRERVDALVRASVDNPDDPFSLARIESEELSANPGRLADEANTVPLFGGRRAIRVRAGSRNILSGIEGVLGAKLQDCRVVIEAGDLKRGAALRTACERGCIRHDRQHVVDLDTLVAPRIKRELAQLRARGAAIAAEQRDERSTGVRRDGQIRSAHLVVDQAAERDLVVDVTRHGGRDLRLLAQHAQRRVFAQITGLDDDTAIARRRFQQHFDRGKDVVSGVHP